MSAYKYLRPLLLGVCLSFILYPNIVVCAQDAISVVGSWSGYASQSEVAAEGATLDDLGLPHDVLRAILPKP